MKKKKKGFTLIELVAVMFISAILGSLVVSLFLSSNKMLISSNSESILQDEGRIVIDAIENDLKVAKKESIKRLTVATNGYDGVTFEDSSGNMYSYIVDSANKKLKKTKGATFVEVATPTSNLELFSINQIAGEQYKVELKLKKKEVEESFVSVITPRNKQLTTF